MDPARATGKLPSVEWKVAALDAYVALLLSAFGGTLFGPVLMRVAGGNGTAGVVAGLLGGVAAHYVAEAMGIGDLLGPLLALLGEPAFLRPGLIRHAQDFLEGAFGGGGMALLIGMVIKKA